MQEMTELAKNPNLTTEDIEGIISFATQIYHRSTYNPCYIRATATCYPNPSEPGSEMCWHPPIQQILQVCTVFYYTRTRNTTALFSNCSIAWDNTQTFSTEALIQIAQYFYCYSPENSDGWQCFVRLLSQIVKCPDFSIEQLRQLVNSSILHLNGSEKERLLTEQLLHLAQDQSLTNTSRLSL